MKKDLFLGSSQTLFARYLILLTMLLSIGIWGQINEGFETGLRTSGYAGNGTNSGNLTLTSGDWIFVNSGLRSTTRNSGSYGCQMQSGTGNSATLPTLNTCGTISFWFSGGTPTLSKTVGGVTTAIALVKSGNNYSATINDASSSIVLRISNSAATSYLDDVITTAFAASPADHIEFTTTATSAAIGNPATYEVKAMNSASQVDAGYSSNITLSKVSGPGNVGGTLSKAATSGVATFSDITFDAAGTYVLKATSPTLGDATTANIIVTTAVVYNKITSLTDLSDGEYVIVANSTRALNNDNTTAGKLGVTAVAVSGNQIINPAAAIVWTIATSGSSKTIFNAASSAYVSGGGSNTNLTLSATASSTSQQWTPSIVSGLFRFLNAVQTTRAISLSGTSPFGQYAISNIDNSSYFDLVLYKKGISGFTVTFNSNGGSGSMPNQTASVPTNLITNVFTRAGYTFAGWATTATGAVAYANEASYPFAADATLYAVWTPNNNTITFDKNAADATGTMVNQTIATAATANLNNNAFVRSGYAFSGWATTAGGTVTYANGASYVMGTSNVTLYAVWSTLAPYITTNGSLSEVSTVYGTASATPASFTVSAGNLTNNLIVTPAPGFEVSLTAGGSYTTSLNLGTTITPNTPVYVRLGATTAFGTYNGNINLASGTTTATIATVASNVSKKTLTITGITGANKVYDGTTGAFVSGTPMYNGLVNGEAFSVTGTVAFSFVNANAGTGKTLTNTGSYDAPSINYAVTQPALIANISPKTLSITAPTLASKVYDGTTATGAITLGTLSGFVGAETVSATATGNYATADAGTGKTATITYVLVNGTNGGLAANYSLAQGSGTGNITKATPVYSSTTISVSVGGNQTIGSSISNSPGALTFSSLNTGIATVGTTTGTVTGVAVGSTSVNVTQAEDTNYIAGSTTIPVTVSTIVYNNGDFRSTTDGNWHSTQASNTATWETYNGSTWVASATAPPVNAAGLGTKTVYIRNTIMLVGNNTAPNVTIESGGVLNTSTVTATFGNLLVRSGGIFNRQGNGSGVSGNFEVEDNATVNFYHTNTTSRSTTIWAGTEKFHANSNFVIKTTDSGSNFLVIQSNNDVSEYNGACFGNLIVDLGTGTLQLLPAGFNKVLANNLIFRTATGNVRFSDSTYSFGVLNNIEIENTYSNTLTALTAAGTSTITVGGNLIYNGSSILRLANNATAAVTLNVNGDILLNSGTLDLNAVSGGSGTVNLKGDLTVGSSASFVAGNGTTATFNFAGTGDGLSDAATQTVNVTNAATTSNIAFNVNSGAYVKLINQNFALGTNSKIDVLSGGTLDFGYNGSAALNILRVSGNIGQSFNAAGGSILKISSPDGLSNGGTYTGNVQLGSTTAARVFSPAATYHYIGKTSQSTGSGLPSQLTGKLIVELDTQNTTQDDLEFTSSGSTTFGTANGINGILEIRKGKVIDEPNNGFRNYNGATDDGENDIQRGDMSMSGGRYVVSGAGTKPALSGTYSLAAGNVEFAGTAATKIRIKPNYYNVDISGTNVESGGKNFVVNNLLKVTGANAILTIPEVTLDSETPYVVTAKKGIQVVAGGKALFKNNAILMQDKDAANSGNITMERKANVPSTQYNYWTSPVKNQALYSIYQGIPSNSVMVYNSANDKFTILTTASNPVSQFGKGYSIKGSATLGAAVTANFTGEPNNETTAGSNSIALSTAGSNYNLVGNPYPSNLNLVALYNANSTKFYNAGDETPTAYLWDNTSNTNLTQLGTGYINQNYAMVNLSSGMGLPAPRLSSAGKQPNGIVKPGQGFIIRAAETGGSLIFSNATMRTSNIAMGGTNSQYYKGDSENGDKFYLKLTTANDMHMMIAVAYYPEAENSFERFDSAVFSEAVTENFYSLSSDSKKLAIQARKGNFNMDDVIPLGIKTSATGNQKINIESKDGIFTEGQNIYLKDKLLNKTVNLTAGDYTFQSVKGTDLTRFEIVYKEEAVLGTQTAAKSDFVTYRDGNNVVVKSSKILGKIEVLDVSGRLLKTFTSNQSTTKIDLSDFSNGIYILKVENSGDMRTKKINR